jgi:hypothetical protein
VLKKPPVCGIHVACETPVFHEKWFTGDVDFDEGDVAENDLGKKLPPPQHHKSEAYPLYLKVGGIGNLHGEGLVKGSLCQAIMKLYEQGLSAGRTSRGIGSKDTGWYSFSDIENIIKACKEDGLHGKTPLATQGWENEPIEGWWLKEEGYCESLRRQLPVSKEVCGYDCDNGFWTKMESQNNRDWDRWGEREIGPQEGETKE